MGKLYNCKMRKCKRRPNEGPRETTLRYLKGDQSEGGYLHLATPYKNQINQSQRVALLRTRSPCAVYSRNMVAADSG